MFLISVKYKKKYSTYTNVNNNSLYKLITLF